MNDRDAVTARLVDAGFIAANDEAGELLRSANGDSAVLESMVARRLRGEPLAWILGFTDFCGQRIRIDEGVFVPRWHSELIADRAVVRLPSRGTAVDLCTGCGAIAKTLKTRRPEARVVATELDDRSVACAASNGVEVFRGDLFAPLPQGLEGTVDVVAGVVPYVPTRSMTLLSRDTLVFESTLSYDGGEDGADILHRVVRESPRFLRPGGALLIELGGGEAELLQPDLARHGFRDVTVLRDDDGDVRGIEATWDHPS